MVSEIDEDKIFYSLVQNLPTSAMKNSRFKAEQSQKSYKIIAKV
jgi:hypothetical protein